MNGPGRGRKVAILSSVHLALDNRVFYREARTLVRAGYDVTLIAVHDRDEVRDGVRVVPLPRVARSRRPLLWRTLAQMARATEADVFHFHDPELLLLSPWLRRATGRPTIYDIHEANADFIAVKEYLPTTARRPLAGLFRRLEPRLAAGESGLIFADEAIAADFDGFGGPKTTLFNFPGRELINAGAAAGGARRESLVLYLGGMERNRGSELMLDAFARVLAQMPAARLRLVGHFAPPGLEGEMRAEAARRGIGHTVEFAGRVPFAQVGEHLAAARVGWVTWGAAAKNRKNIPTKLFEYMAYGLPVVCSDLPSTRPFVLPDVGLLAGADDPAGHAAALLRLLSDPATAEALGAAGQRRVADEWNWSMMEPRLLGLYEAVLGRG
jgi:glycosyltransferase involved in cell wall biosynthesis